MSSPQLTLLPSHYWVKVTIGIPVEANDIEIKSADRPPKLSSVSTLLSSKSKHIACSPGLDSLEAAEAWLAAHPEWLKDAESHHLLQADKSLSI